MDVGGNSNNYTQDPSSLKKRGKSLLVSGNLCFPNNLYLESRVVFGSLHVCLALLLPLRTSNLQCLSGPTQIPLHINSVRVEQALKLQNLG